MHSGTREIAREPGGYSQYFDVAAYELWENKKPALAYGSAGFLFAYEGDPPVGYQHIYGRYWMPETVYLPITYR